MNVSTTSIRRLGKATALTLAAAAVAVPLAHGEGSPDAKGYGAQNRFPYTPAQATQISSVGKYGPLDRWPYDASQSAPAMMIANASGFAWGDAGVGAAGAFGLMLVGTGGMFVLRRRRPLAH